MLTALGEGDAAAEHFHIARAQPDDQAPPLLGRSTPLTAATLMPAVRKSAAICSACWIVQQKQIAMAGWSRGRECETASPGWWVSS